MPDTSTTKVIDTAAPNTAYLKDVDRRLSDAGQLALQHRPYATGDWDRAG